MRHKMKVEVGRGGGVQARVVEANGIMLQASGYRAEEDIEQEAKCLDDICAEGMQ